MPFTSCTGHTRTTQLGGLAAQGDGPHAAARTVYPRCRTPPVPAQGPETGCIADVQPQLLQLTPCSELLLMHCSF